MNFRNLFLSLFLVLAVGFALVQADDAKKEPRGPKITNKVCTAHISPIHPATHTN